VKLDQDGHFSGTMYFGTNQPNQTGAHFLVSVVAVPKASSDAFSQEAKGSPGGALPAKTWGQLEDSGTTSLSTYTYVLVSSGNSAEAAVARPAQAPTLSAVARDDAADQVAAHAGEEDQTAQDAP
jgi:hypothetical protein